MARSRVTEQVRWMVRNQLQEAGFDPSLTASDLSIIIRRASKRVTELLKRRFLGMGGDDTEC